MNDTPTSVNLGSDKLTILLGQKVLSESESLHVLVLIRKEMETFSKSEATKYSHVKLFCDWVLHIAIDQSRAGSKLIANIHDAIETVRHAPTDQVISQISASLLASFKNELAQFLQGKGLPDAVAVDHAGWRLFLRNVLELICASPVRVLDKERQQIEDNPLKAGMWVTSISVIKMNYDKIWDESSSSTKETYALLIVTSDTTKIVVPITPAV